MTSGIGPKTKAVELRKLIAQKLNEDPKNDDLWIYFRNIKIDSKVDNKTLSELGIKDGANIYVVYRVIGGSDWTFNISTIDDRFINVTIYDSENVLGLKKAIYNK